MSIMLFLKRISVSTVHSVFNQIWLISKITRKLSRKWYETKNDMDPSIVLMT